MKQLSGRRFLFPVCGIILLLLFPTEAGAGVRSGLQLCGNVLIPSLFPVSVLAGCLLRMQPDRAAERLTGGWMQTLFGLPGACSVPVSLGLLGGFPLGAQLTATLYREGGISRAAAVRLSMICNFAGPAFLFGIVGTALGGQPYGAVLFLIQFVSAVLSGMLLFDPQDSTEENNHNFRQPALSFWDALPASISESAAGMLRLTGAIVFFSAMTACLSVLLPLHALPQIGKSILLGILEVSSGIDSLRGIPHLYSFPTAAFLVGWGGLCVHLQAAGALHVVGLPVKPYLISKLLQGLVSSVISCLLLPTFTGSASIWFWFCLVATGVLFFFAVFKKIHWKTSSPVL